MNPQALRLWIEVCSLAAAVTIDATAYKLHSLKMGQSHLALLL